MLINMETVASVDASLSDKNAEKPSTIDNKPRAGVAKRGNNSRNNEASAGDNGSRIGQRHRRSYNDYDRNVHYIPRTVIRGRGSRFGRNRPYDNWNGSYSDSDGRPIYNAYHDGRGGFYPEMGRNSGSYYDGNDYRRRGFVPGPPRRRRFNPNLSRRRTDSDNVVTDHRRRPPKLRTTSETAAKHENGSHDGSGENHSSPNNNNGDETQAVKQKSGNGRRNNREQRRPYRTQPVERLPRHFATVLVSGIPKTMCENGLFNYMQCFGDVANIRKVESDNKSVATPVESGGESGGETKEKVADKKGEVEREKVEREKEKPEDKTPSGGEEEKKDNTDGFYSAYISFFNKLALKNISAKKPVTIFDNEVQITEYRPPRRSGRSSSKSKKETKEKSTGRSIFDLGDKVLVKIFEAMDFHTRFNAQFVCRRWHKNMARVRTPAFDAPSNVTFRIKRSEKEDRNEPVLTKYDTENAILTVSVSPYYRRIDAFLSYLVNNIIHQFGSGIEKVEASNVRLTLDILLAIGLDSVSSIVIDRCTIVGGTDFSVLHSFCSHLGDRLKLLNATYSPWPGKMSGTNEKLRSRAALKQSGGATIANEKPAQ